MYHNYLSKYFLMIRRFFFLNPLSGIKFCVKSAKSPNYLTNDILKIMMFVRLVLHHLSNDHY